MDDGGRRHEHEPRRIAILRRDAGTVCLQRALLRRHRPGNAQQPAADWQRHELLEQGRQPRAEDRIRVVPQPARRRRLAVIDQLRVRLRLRAGRRQPAVARRHGPSCTDLRARCVRRGLHSGDTRCRAERRHELVLRPGPLGDQQPLVGGSGCALRTREGGVDRGHRRREQPPDRSPVGSRPRCAGRRQAPAPCDIRHVFRAVQRAADRKEQSGGQRSGSLHRVPGTSRPGP